MTLTRCTVYPPRPVGRATLGFHVNETLGVATARTRFLAAGATMARWQPSWENVEDYATGNLALPASTTGELTWCAANGVAPVLVAAYGPPYALLQTVTLASAAAAGALTLTVNEAITGVDAPFCHIRASNGSQIVASPMWSYPGALIHSVNTATKTLTLAAATNIALSAGATLHINRLRYASLPDADSTNPGVTAYLRYAQFLADQIHAAGCTTGWVSLWNEPPWAHDHWDNRYDLYDAPPAGVVDSHKLGAILAAAINMTGLPRGVRFINGASDKTAFFSVVLQDAEITTAAQVTTAMAAESQHPYHDNPEAFAWDPSSIDDLYGNSWWQAVNPTMDAKGVSDNNFRLQSRRLKLFADAHGGVAPRLMATELGSDAVDDTRQAIYLLRRVISQWGMDVTPIVYALAEGSPYDVLNATTYAPRTSHAALARLMSQVAALGGPGKARALPTPIAVPDSRWPVMIVGLYGKNGGLLLAWQRTWSPDSTWASISRPIPTRPVRFHVASGVTIVDSVDLLTGSTVTVTPSGGTFTLDLTDTPIAVRTTV